MKTSDTAWLAGLLEGEGHFHVRASGTPRITLDMTDKDVVERAARLMKCPLYGPLREANLSKVWRAQASGVNARGIMMTVLSLLGQRRSKKVEEILQVWRNHVRPPMGTQIPWIKEKATKASIHKRQLQGWSRFDPATRRTLCKTCNNLTKRYYAKHNGWPVLLWAKV